MSKSKRKLMAGSAMIDLTPPLGTHLAGSEAGMHRPAKVINDPLFVKALVLESGGKKICILSMDLLIVTQEWTDRIRQAASLRYGFQADAVMVHVVQNHSAPTLGHMMFDKDFPNLPAEIEYLRGGETVYYEYACEKAIEAIGAALKDMKPVRLAFGSAVRDDLASNRRAVTKDGKVVMPGLWEPPLGPTYIKYMEGPMDPEVAVVCLREKEGAGSSMILHYTCHPVNVFCTKSYTISGDWPGAWSAAMRKRAGRKCVPLVLNGCCGNINPWSPFRPGFKMDHVRMGNELAATSRLILQGMQFADVGKLDLRVRRIRIPLKKPDRKRVAWARKILEAHPEPLWSKGVKKGIDPEWFRAASIISVELMRRRSQYLKYEIQVARIGDVAIVGLPGEPFVEGQLAIKIGSPAKCTIVAHAMTHYVGYIPTHEAFPHGGHEVDFSYWAKLDPCALDMVVKNTLEMLAEIF